MPPVLQTNGNGKYRQALTVIIGTIQWINHPAKIRILFMHTALLSQHTMRRKTLRNLFQQISLTLPVGTGYDIRYIRLGVNV